MNEILISIRHNIMEFFRNALWRIGKVLPTNPKKVVVSCFKGRGYCDNPKYIVDALLRIDSSIKVVWLVSNKEQASTLPANVIPCYYNRLKAVYHFVTSLIWIDNVRKDEKFIKKENQFYLQTWHGGGAIKRVEKDVEEKLSSIYVKKAQRESKSIDLFVSEGEFYSKLYHRSFWYEGHVAELGLPRYDLVLQKHDDIELKKKIRDYFGVPYDKKIVLYAPTFRNGYSFDAYNIDHIKMLDACKKRFGGDFVSYVHLHPNVANKFSQLKYDGVRIINATYYPDMQELITASDILISDYSSVIIDFSLSKKPAFIFATDINEYENDRGSYFDFRKEYPFPLAENNEELISAICNFNEEEYAKDLTSYFERIGLVFNEHSSDDYAQLLLDYINNQNKEALFEKYQAILR